MEKICRLRKGNGWTPSRFWPELICYESEVDKCKADNWHMHPDQSNLETFREKLEAQKNGD